MSAFSRPSAPPSPATASTRLASSSSSPRLAPPRAYAGPGNAPAAVGVPPADARSVPARPPPPPPPPPPLAYKVSLFDIFKFAGPAPETINGRLAMAFLPVLAAAEASTGASAATLGDRLLHPPLAPASAGAAALAGLVVVASLVPMRVGAVAEAFGPFTPGRERAAGRAAMLGWAALLVLEARAGGVPFF